jgi:hypothetical protein
MFVLWFWNNLTKFVIGFWTEHFLKNGHEKVFSVFTRLKYDFKVETWRGEPENAQKMFIKASRHDPCVPFL